MSASSGRSTAPKPPSADDEGFKRELVQLIPHLRAFARTLTGARFFALARTGDGRLAVPGAIEREPGTELGTVIEERAAPTFPGQ